MYLEQSKLNIQNDFSNTYNYIKITLSFYHNIFSQTIEIFGHHSTSANLKDFSINFSSIKY